MKLTVEIIFNELIIASKRRLLDIIRSEQFGTFNMLKFEIDHSPHEGFTMKGNIFSKTLINSSSSLLIL